MTMPDDSQILAQILIEQGKLSAQLDVIDERLKSIPDHETRIRALERWRYALPTSVLLGLGSATAAVVSVLHR